MKQILTLLIVLMISLNLSGCLGKDLPPPEPVIKIVNVYHYTPCEKDQVPNYVELIVDKHLGSAENANILLGNLVVMKDYNKSLLGTIDCYEKQIKSEKTNE